jgi:hypothetical protein
LTQWRQYLSCSRLPWLYEWIVGSSAVTWERAPPASWSVHRDTQMSLHCHPASE